MPPSVGELRALHVAACASWSAGHGVAWRTSTLAASSAGGAASHALASRSDHLAMLPSAQPTGRTSTLSCPASPAQHQTALSSKRPASLVAGLQRPLSSKASRQTHKVHAARVQPVPHPSQLFCPIPRSTPRLARQPDRTSRLRRWWRRCEGAPAPGGPALFRTSATSTVKPQQLPNWGSQVTGADAASGACRSLLTPSTATTLHHHAQLFCRTPLALSQAQGSSQAPAQSRHAGVKESCLPQPSFTTCRMPLQCTESRAAPPALLRGSTGLGSLALPPKSTSPRGGRSPQEAQSHGGARAPRPPRPCALFKVPPQPPPSSTAARSGPAGQLPARPLLNNTPPQEQQAQHAHPSQSRKGTRRMRAWRQPLMGSSRSLQVVPAGV